MIHLGMHTDNWRTLSGNVEQAVRSAKENGLAFVEFGVVDGQDFIEGLGYSPAVSLDANPLALRRDLEKIGLRVSQIDAGFPITGPSGATYGVRYIQRAIQFAHLVGAPYVDTTDGAHKPAGYTDEEILAITKQNYRLVLEWAEAFKVGVNVEPHGPFTTNPDTMERILGFHDSPWIGVNFDTGNTFVAGQDPVAFAKRFAKRIRHVHCKDVSRQLCDAIRGGITGIACSNAAIGEGVNAENIRGVIRVLNGIGWDGVFSIECEGLTDTIRRSVEWLRKVKDAR